MEFLIFVAVLMLFALWRWRKGARRPVGATRRRRESAGRLVGVARRRRESAGRLVGAARVVDGDGIVVNGLELRLEGIDAPEARQTSIDARGRPFPQGKRATRHLRALIGSDPVRCELHGLDRHGRRLATVFAADGRNVNAEMVRAGQAIAYLKFSRRYAREEAEAKRCRRGMHSGAWITPRAWRTGRRVTGPAVRS